MGTSAGGVTRRAVALAAAILFLNASVTFENLWPTPAIRWHGRLSIEFAVLVLLMAFLTLRRSQRHDVKGDDDGMKPPGSPKLTRWLSAMWTLLVIGRYAEVTAPALYGRDVNLYWDLRFIPDVVAMATRVANLRLLVLAAALAAGMLVVLYLLVRSAWIAVTKAMRDRRLGSVLAAASFAMLIGALGERLAGRDAMFAPPVTHTYARQVRFAAEAISGSSPVAGSPSMDSDLSRVAGADVLLVFVESYGAVSFEHPGIAQGLAAARARLEASVHRAKFGAVSAYVESPTFGGSSWLAHLSLMSGVEVRDPRTNARLMTERRDTVVRLFDRRGFRTIALMPGLRQRWPEGVFYGFNEIYGAERLAYRGPEFGWFAIPDQYSLDRLDALEVNRSPRPPLFVFFPTLTTHFPFNPTPPYQPDWRRMASDRPFDGPEIVRAYAREPDWFNFAPGYIDAVSYELDTLAGYLEKNAARDFVMILIGDHQPPALVSGERATWDVPVHVITARTPVLERLLARGFRQGLAPQPPRVARMHALLPILLEAFGERR